jgi:hypothetical protein
MTLTVIVLANLLVERFRISNPQPYYGLLLGVLLFDFFVSVGSYLDLPLG